MKHRFLLTTLLMLCLPILAMAQYWESGTTRTNMFYNYTSGNNKYERTQVSYLINPEQDGKVEFAAQALGNVRITGITLFAVEEEGDLLVDNGYQTLKVENLAAGLYRVVFAGQPTDRAGQGGNFQAAYVFTPADYVNDPEPNNTWERAYQIESGNTQHGHLGYKRYGSTDDEDWYKIVVPDEGTVTFSVRTSTKLRLGWFGMYTPKADSTGVDYRNDRWMNADGKDTTLVYAVPDCKPGEYYVRVSRSDGYGSYKMNYTFTANSYSSDSPDNETWDKAIDMALDTPTDGRLGYIYNGDTDGEDWYKIEVLEEGKLTFLVKAETTLNLGWFGMYTPKVDGTGVDYRNDRWMNASGKDTTLVYEVPDVSIGTYYVKVSRSGGYGGYRVTCYFTSHADEADPEPNDTWKEALTLKSGPAITGQLGYNYNNSTDQVDWYKIDVDKEGAAVFSVKTETTLNLGWFGMYTPKADGTDVDYRNDMWMNASGKDTTLVYTVPDCKPGIYYVRVTRSGGYGTYTLQYVHNPNAHENDPEPNDEWTQGTIIESGTTQQGCLGYVYNKDTDTEDWFKIELPDEGSVSFAVTAETTLNLGWFGMYTPKADGTGVDYRNDRWMNASGKDTTLVYTVSDCKPGIYYVRVTRSGGYGGYDIDYTFTPNRHTQDNLDNDTWDKATFIENNTTQQGRLGYVYNRDTDAEDWFKIELPDEGSVSFAVTAETTLSLGWFGMYTPKTDGTGVDYRNDKWMNASGKDTTLVYTVPNCKPGIYYVKVSRSSSYGGYNIDYTFTPDVYGPDFADNETWGKATTIENGFTQQGRLGYVYNGDTDGEDWYKIDVPYVGDVTLSIRNENTLKIGWFGLYVPNADGNNVSLVSDKWVGQDGQESDYVFNLNGRGAGIYYVRVQRSDGYGGYALKYDYERNPYDRDNIQNGSFANRYQLEEGKLVSTTMGYKYINQNNEDWYDLGMMHGRQIDVTLFPDTTHTLVIGVPALYIYEGDKEDGSPILTKVAESRIERSQGTISYLDKNDEDKHYVFRVPNYSSGSYGGYLILFGDEYKDEEPLIAKSGVSIMTSGRNTVRKGVPCENPITITNTSTEKTGAFILAITATDDVDILGFRLRGRYGSRYLPVDSVTTIGETDCENTLLFLVPSLNPWESYTFTMISEGEGDIAYAPIRSPHSTGRNQIVINGNTYVVVTAMGYVDENSEGKKLSDYILKKVATVFGLDDAERTVLRKSIDLTVEELDADKQETGVAVYGMKSVMKQVFAHIAELLPGSEFAAQLERIDKMPCQLALPIRQRVFYWIYQDKNYLQDDIEIYDGKAAITDIVASWDPNEMVGPAGVGEQRYIGDVKTVNYRILFENKAEAGAPAYRIRISDELDENVFDVSSARFGATSHDGVGYQWKMTRDGNKLSWDIEGIELPPNVNAPEGEGYVEFSVDLKPGLNNGTQIKNKATIIFDKNTPIETNEFVNTIDILPPVTTMAEAGYSYGDKVNVVCNTADEGAGVQSYLLFVSKDGGDYTYYGQSVTSTIPYPVATGEVATYSFYVLAIDNVGNVEEIIPESVSVTGIETVKIVNDPNASIKVYTIDGRYVGDSIKGLSKGVYVVGGRKMVIK